MRDIFADQAFLFSLSNFGIKLGLENIQNAMRCLGYPNLESKIIHIAGTNGKGSTLMCLEKLLIDSGYSVCSTISPHLIKFNERFRHQGQSVSDKELNDCYNELLANLRITPAIFPYHDKWPIQLTFFEIAIAIAFLFFRKKKPDFVILETGMGGRLDATNICPSIMHLITSISLEHTEYLGDSLEKIAFEKTGIIKNNSPTFLSKQASNEVELVVQKHCESKKSPLYKFGQSFSWTLKQEQVKFKVKNHPSLVFNIQDLSLKGNHQFDNICLALATYYRLTDIRAQDTVKIKKSIQSVKNQGRMEWIKNTPPILLDAAHNNDGIQKLIAYLNSHFSKKNIAVCIGWLENKKIPSAWKRKQNFNPVFFPLQMEYFSALSGEKIYEELNRESLPVSFQRMNVSKLVKKINAGFFKGFDMILVCGSIYLLGEILKNKEFAKISKKT